MILGSKIWSGGLSGPLEAHALTLSIEGELPADQIPPVPLRADPHLARSAIMAGNNGKGAPQGGCYGNQKGHRLYFAGFGSAQETFPVQPFIPQQLPPPDLSWEPLIRALGQANRSLARFSGILEALPNPGILLSPILTQEAVLSSKIEGTQATLGDVLRYEAGQAPVRPSRVEDIREILNYRKALLSGEVELQTRQFSLSLLKALHQLLLAGTRGKDKSPGAFRVTQNWIGEPGGLIEDAAFVPPIPSLVQSSMEAWEAYYQSNSDDPLAQLATIHAQFEIVHPFNDGNGRIGRILIPLFLYEKKVLPRPMFYLSSWLEEHREEYIARLRAIGREMGAWTQWCLFFFRAIEEEGERNAIAARDILALYTQLKDRVIQLTHSQFAVPLLDQIFKKPVFRSSDIQLRATRTAIANLLRALREGEVLTVIQEGAGRRPWIYAQADLLNIAERGRLIREGEMPDELR